MPHVPAHNPLDVPVIVDVDGRQLAGGAWGLADTDLYQVQSAVDAQRLIIFPQGLPGDADPAIRAAVYGVENHPEDDDPSTVVHADAPEVPPAKQAAKASSSRSR